MNIEKVAVLGAGNGGLAAAADLSLRGFDVRLYNRSQDRITPLLRRSGIEITGEAGNGFARLSIITSNIQKAIKNADLILVVVPAFAQHSIAIHCAPFLENGQLIVLNPGRGGALVFAKLFKESGSNVNIRLAETNTLTYGCRRIASTKVNIGLVVKKLLFAAFPGKETAKNIDVFNKVYPHVVPGINVLETCLHNMNAPCHPPQMLFNIGSIESKEEFNIYSDGTTPSVAKIIEKIDKERLMVCKALNLRPISYADWVFQTGYSPIKGSIYEQIQASKTIRYVKAPSLRSRYITEDVPYGLVPIASLAHLFDISTPIVSAMIEIASSVNQINYWEKGRTLEKMGLAGFTIEELNHYLSNGEAEPYSR